MDRKSIAQEYFALATDENGNMPPMHRDESKAGIMAACIMDLLLKDVITMERKRITVIEELPGELAHESSLHDYLSEEVRTADKLMSDYLLSSNARRIKQPATDIGEVLLADGVVREGNGGLFGPKVTYVTAESYRKELVDRVRSAATKNDDVSSHDMALLYILKETKNLNRYFSKEESDQLKDRLKEMKKNPQNKQVAVMINCVTDITTIAMACILMIGLH